MNKKLVAIIVGTIAVLAIVIIAIFGSLGVNTDKTVNVAEVRIDSGNDNTYTQDDNTIAKIKTLDNGQTTYQLVWSVLPENATNKTVTFTDDKENVTVSETGLVTFTSQENVVVTISSNSNQEKKAYILLKFDAPKQEDVSVTYGSTGVSFNSQAEHPIHTTNENTLVVYTNSTYVLALENDISVKISNDTTAKLTGIVLETKDAEEFVLRFTKQATETTEEQFFDVPVKVVTYIDTFNQGLQYGSYLSTVSKLGTSASEFMNSVATPYLVGNKNAYHFNMTILDPNTNVIPLSSVEFNFVVKENEQVIDLSSIATIENNEITFLDSAIGHTYTFSISPKYNISNLATLNYTVTVNSAVNVWTSDQLYNAYKDLTVNSIDIQSNIVVTPRANQLVTMTNVDTNATETRLNNYGNLNNGSDSLRDNAGTLFPRYIPSTFTGINEVTVNGNYFFLNASSVPYFNYDGRDGQAGALPWAKDIASVQEGLFQLQDNRATANIGDDNYSSSTFQNVKLVGNSAKGPIYTATDLGSLTDEEEIARITVQGSGLPLVMTRGGIIKAENVNASGSIFTFWSAGQKAEVNLTDTKVYNSWGGAVYGYGTSEITLTNVNFTKMGGAAIAYEDSSYSNAQSPDYMDLTLTFNENVVIENYLTGAEGWFVVNGFTGIVPTLKTQIQNTLNQVSKSMIYFDQEAQAEEFNYILQIVSSMSKTAEQEPVDIQYTIKQITNLDEVSGVRTYRTTSRKTGFTAAHPFSVANGSYVGPVSEYSDVNNFKTLETTFAFAYDYLVGVTGTQDPTFANFGLGSYPASPAKTALTNQIQIAYATYAPSYTGNDLMFHIALDKTLQEKTMALIAEVNAASAGMGDAIVSGIASNANFINAAFAASFVASDADTTTDILEIVSSVPVGDSSKQLDVFVGYFPYVA